MKARKLFRQVKSVNLKYNLIENNDRVAVAVSGGKDSLVLLSALNLLRRYTPLKFEMVAVTIDLGWPVDWAPVTEYCRSLSVEHHIVKTQIGHLIFEERQESNPCALCANLRSGVLHRKARVLECNKVALAHHLDDAVTTLLLSMVFNGQFRTFKPATYLNRSNITLIRPLVYTEEKDIISYVRCNHLPVVTNPCPAAGQTNRDRIKSWLDELNHHYPNARRHILKALENADPNSFWSTERLFWSRDE